MKKKIFILFLILLTIILTGCRGYYVAANEPNSATCIDLRENYKFAEDVYTIQNTPEGYDIIIHCVPK